MDTLSVERYARLGFAAYREKNFKRAAECFRQALELDRQRNQRQPDMRYLSFYGLSLAKAGLSSKIAIQACTRAVSHKRTDPVLFLNLGRVYAMSGQETSAMRAFQQGLALAPDHLQLRRALGSLDRRSRPVVPFLHRDHSVNRTLGRLRAGLRRRRAEDPVAAPG